jgi:hypothetical protein
MVVLQTATMTLASTTVTEKPMTQILPRALIAIVMTWGAPRDATSLNIAGLPRMLTMMPTRNHLGAGVDEILAQTALR